MDTNFLTNEYSRFYKTFTEGMKKYSYIALIIFVVSDVNATSKRQLKLFSGTSNFAAILQLDNFVDKTLFIKDFFSTFSLGDYNEGTHSLFTAPRGFGKSVNLDMMRRFVELPFDDNGTEINLESSYNYLLFTNESLNLKITKYSEIIEKHCGKYPVIYIDFKGMLGQDHEQTVNNVRFVFKVSFQRYKWLYTHLETKLKYGYLTPDEVIDHEFLDRVLSETLTEEGLLRGLQRLVNMVYMHFRRRIFLFVDNYDDTAMDVLAGDGSTIMKAQGLIHAVVNNAVAGALSVQQIGFTYITGILTLFTDKYGATKPGNVNYYNFLSDSHPFHLNFGFTIDEVLDLFERLNIPNEELRRVVDYYGAYHLTCETTNIFCTSSIIEYTRYRKLKPYWVDSGCIPFISRYLKDTTTREIMINLILRYPTGRKFENIAGFFTMTLLEMFRGAILDKIDKLYMMDRARFFQYLFESGYISPAGQPGVFKIPNLEIKEYFTNELMKYYSYIVDLTVIRKLLEELLHVTTPSTEALVLYQSALAREFNKVLGIRDKRDLLGCEFELRTIFYLAATQHLDMKIIHFQDNRNVTNANLGFNIENLIVKDRYRPCLVIIRMSCFLAGSASTYRNVFKVLSSAKEQNLPADYYKNNMEVRHLGISITVNNDDVEVSLLFNSNTT